MGQKRVVEVYHLELEVEHENIDTIRIDELVDKKAQEKRMLLDHIFHLCAKATEEAQSEEVEEAEEVEDKEEAEEEDEEEAESEAEEEDEEEEETEPGNI
jgi:hypothetical protein